MRSGSSVAPDILATAMTAIRRARTIIMAADASAAHPPLVDPQARVVDYLRVSVTDRCNYRCVYCVPPEGVARASRSGVLDLDEIAALVRVFVDLGVRRVRLTGGEPTVRRDLPSVVRALRAIPDLRDISLTTNGHLLAQLAAPLLDAGLDRLNVSLDSLDAERFRRITGGGELARVLAGLEEAARLGFRSIKLNTVAIAGFNDDELGGLVQFAWQRGFVPRFIEEMPMAGGGTHRPGALLTAEEIRRRIAALVPGGGVVPDSGEPSSAEIADLRHLGAGPARYFRVLARGEDRARTAPRRFGIISPMTEHFCASCNRVRLSATGALHPCLGYDDAVDLRAPLRAGGPGAVASEIRRALARKRDGHVFNLVGLGGPRKAMVQIGG
jgi:GTP 3',8-cyclase